MLRQRLHRLLELRRNPGLLLLQARLLGTQGGSELCHPFQPATRLPSQGVHGLELGIGALDDQVELAASAGLILDHLAQHTRGLVPQVRDDGSRLGPEAVGVTAEAVAHVPQTGVCRHQFRPQLVEVRLDGVRENV